MGPHTCATSAMKMHRASPSPIGPGRTQRSSQPPGTLVIMMASTAKPLQEEMACTFTTSTIFGNQGQANCFSFGSSSGSHYVPSSFAFKSYPLLFLQMREFPKIAVVSPNLKTQPNILYNITPTNTTRHLAIFHPKITDQQNASGRRYRTKMPRANAQNERPIQPNPPR